MKPPTSRDPYCRKNSPEVVSKVAFKPRKVRKLEDAKDHDPQDKSTTVRFFLSAVFRTCRKHPLQDVSANGSGSRHNATEPSSLKGLDFALLEQEKARAGLLSTNDVDELEQAFAESSAFHDSEQVAPRKRTRQDLIRELKQKRLENEGQPPDTNKVDAPLEEAKQRSKFKPIGFASTGKRKKEEADKKKKRRKVDTDQNVSDSQVKPFMADTKIIPKPHDAPVEEGFDDNFDIFAGAGEYTGVDIDENEEAKVESPHKIEESSLPQRWLAMGDSEFPVKPHVSTQSPIPVPEDTKTAAEQDQEVAKRLAPLESSAVPSIKELLEMHDVADKYDKKMKQKEKKQRKRGGKGKASDDE